MKFIYPSHFALIFLLPALHVLAGHNADAPSFIRSRKHHRDVRNVTRRAAPPPPSGPMTLVDKFAGPSFFKYVARIYIYMLGLIVWHLVISIFSRSLILRMVTCNMFLSRKPQRRDWFIRTQTMWFTSELIRTPLFLSVVCANRMWSSSSYSKVSLRVFF